MGTSEKEMQARAKKRFEEVDALVKQHGLETLTTLVEAMSMIREANYDYRKDLDALTKLKDIINLTAELNAKLKPRKKVRLLAACVDALTTLVYKPALSNTNNPQTEDDTSLPLHEDATPITDLRERFANIIQETWRRMSDLEDFEPHVSEPLPVEIEHWSDFQARRKDPNWGGPRKAALFAVEEIFDLRKTSHPIEETSKPCSELEREDVAMRKQKDSVGNHSFLGVENITEAKAALLRDLYSEVVWYDPQQAFIGGTQTYAPFGNKRAAAIVQSARTTQPEE